MRNGNSLFRRMVLLMLVASIMLVSVISFASCKKKDDVNIDTDGDGVPDVNIDTDGDKKPDTNIDTDGDRIPDENLGDDDSGDNDAPFPGYDFGEDGIELPIIPLD